MEFNEYQQLAQRTANQSLDHNTRLLIAALGLGESGEVQNIIKKHIGHGHDLDKEDVCDELGDILWYVVEVASVLNMSIDDIATHNIDKLRKRYPDGFSEERSIHRDDEQEGR